MSMNRKDKGADCGREEPSVAEEYPVSYACPCDPRALAGWMPKGTYMGPRLLYNEPVQGCCGDCYFIAALSSVAWAADAQLSKDPALIMFRDPVSGENSAKITVESTFPVDAANNLIYARSLSGKTWPMLYEKAYAKWKGCALIGGDEDHPDISQIPGGAGIHGLISVSRYANMTQFLTSGNITILNGIPKIATGKTKYPSVAWTHDLVNPPAGIPNDHTYSILGFYQNNVVLRNPVTSMVDPAASLKAGVWNSGSGNINLTIAGDGIFALSVADFNNYFHGFGYVQP